MIKISLSVLTCVLLSLIASTNLPAADNYPIVDTGQNRCFSNSKEISFPGEGEDFFGQDGNYIGAQPSYRYNNDGTISDLVTGLMWQRTPNLEQKSTFSDALKNAGRLTLGGYNDWRLPTIKELYSLINFSGYSNRKISTSKPYINTRYFDFVFGREHLGERLIDAQYWSSTEYVGLTMGGAPTVFGVNFADGRIKGYPRIHPRHGDNQMFVRYVRGNRGYGKNQYVDNGNDTISDKATGLTWMKADSGRPMRWKDALAYSLRVKAGGYGDWRVPNAKELQSIVDYSRAPDSLKKTQGPAIDPIFNITKPESYFWSSTSHLERHQCGAAVYFCFGQSFGTMHGEFMNVHGAGAQRSDPKTGDPKEFPNGRGPQGDDIRILNYVRCVRGGTAEIDPTGPSLESTSYEVKRRTVNDNGGQMENGHSLETDDDRWMGNTERPHHDQGGLQGPEGRGGESFVQRLDRDDDGKISPDEFDGPDFAFYDFDENRDGYIQASEAPSGPPPNGGPPFGPPPNGRPPRRSR